MDKREAITASITHNSTLSRRLGLGLVLGLLGVLVWIMSTKAYVAVNIEDSLADFDSGTFISTGLLDIPEQGIHSVQLLPIGLAGDWATSDRPLPAALADSATVAHGPHIFVVGGTSDAQYRPPVAQVYATRINEVGGTLEAWREERALPEARTGAGIAVQDRGGASFRLYVVGGISEGWTPLDTVVWAEVDRVSGSIGEWQLAAQSLPASLYYAAALIHGDYLYVLGGANGLQSFDTVYYSQINSDGSLTPFAATSTLPEPLFDGYAVVYSGEMTDTVYYVGGAYVTGSYQTRSTFEVYFADVLPSGLLTAWQRSEGSLPSHLYGHSGALVDPGTILLTGGISDPLDPQHSFTSTVKAALVDPDNPSFRLYDWCLGVKPPDCTIGAWQTGGLLPEVRALHGTVVAGDWIYVIGGENGEQTIINTVYWGSVEGAGALYSPTGLYQSNKIDLEQPSILRKLAWQTTIGHPGAMGIALRYQTSSDGVVWSEPSPWQPSQPGLNELLIEGSPTDVHFIQYEAAFSTTIPNASPLLDLVHIYYEVPDPDIAVSKNTGTVISVSLGTTLEYTIRYTNTGGWVAKDVVLTETMPQYASFNGPTGWHQVGTSGVYTYPVGDLPRGETGSTKFEILLDEEVPPGVDAITNRVEIGYPPMTDSLGNVIVDPNLGDNAWELTTPIAFSALTVTKRAIPAAGSVIVPGSTITYTLRYTNVGLVRAEQAVLTDTFDPLDNYVIVQMSPEPSAGGNRWHLGTLTPTAEGMVTVVVRLQDVLPNHWIVTNQAELNSPTDRLYQTPLITHTVMNLSGTQPAPMPDLAISRVEWLPADPTAGEWPSFQATVVNLGTAEVQDPFWVELYIKPRPSEPPRWPNDHDRGYCLGDCNTLPVRSRYIRQADTSGGTQEWSILFENLSEDPSPDFPQAGIYDIYVQVDVAHPAGGHNPYWGRHAEDFEGNNLWQGTLSLQAGRVYLPIILRRSP